MKWGGLRKAGCKDRESTVQHCLNYGSITFSYSQCSLRYTVLMFTVHKLAPRFMNETLSMIIKAC